MHSNGKKPVSVTQDVLFSVLFYDEQWEEIRSLSMRHLTPSEVQAVVFAWANGRHKHFAMQGVDLTPHAGTVIVEVIIEGHNYAF